MQSSDLETDLLIDSGADSNINNITAWHEIHNLHQKLSPLKVSSKLVTAQGKNLTKYGKIQIFLILIRTKERNKFIHLKRIFKQIFKRISHKTEIKHNIVGIPFITKCIPTINILNNNLQIEC